MAVGTLAPGPKDPWPNPPHTEQEIRDKLTYARELLIEHDQGLTNKTLTRREITAKLDHWLEELCELLELQWLPDLEVL